MHVSPSTPAFRSSPAWLLLTVLLCLAPVAKGSGISWEQLAPGLDYARIPFPGVATPEDSSVAVLRIDPERWMLEAHSISETGDSSGLSTRAWAEREGLTAAINAGMYDTDRRTHIGLLVTRSHQNNKRKHGRYEAVLAFDPKHKGIARARTFDLDVTPLKRIQKDYRGVIQNLRLIKRNGENRWEKRGRAWWGESALGEDREGRILFLYTPAVVTMHDFNNVLLALPLGIVSAQHLEGGPQAQLFIRAGKRIIEFHSGHEAGRNGSPAGGLPIPNILGIRPR